jgi:hypothetical protein
MIGRPLTSTRENGNSGSAVPPCTHITAAPETTMGASIVT